MTTQPINLDEYRKEKEVKDAMLNRISGYHQKLKMEVMDAITRAHMPTKAEQLLQHKEEMKILEWFKS